MNEQQSAGAKAPADEKSEKFRLRNQAGEEVGEIDLKQRTGTLKAGAVSGGLIEVNLEPKKSDDKGLKIDSLIH
jgi:hypothetical protein